MTAYLLRLKPWLHRDVSFIWISNSVLARLFWLLCVWMMFLWLQLDFSRLSFDLIDGMEKLLFSGSRSSTGLGLGRGFEFVTGAMRCGCPARLVTTMGSVEPADMAYG